MHPTPHTIYNYSARATRKRNFSVTAIHPTDTSFTDIGTAIKGRWGKGEKKDGNMKWKGEPPEGCASALLISTIFESVATVEARKNLQQISAPQSHRRRRPTTRAGLSFSRLPFGVAAAFPPQQPLLLAVHPPEVPLVVLQVGALERFPDLHGRP